MKRAIAVAAGVVVGVLLAGPMVAVVPLLPGPLRNEYVLWGIGALVVGASVRAAWMLSGPRRE